MGCGNTNQTEPNIQQQIKTTKENYKPQSYINYNRSELKINKKAAIGNFNENIQDSYNFKNKLGEGGFGTVFLIEHKTTGEVFACKRLAKKKIKNRETIFSEINLMKSLDHPNIVKLLEVYEDNTYIFMVMENLLGGELFDEILARAKSNNYYSEKMVATIFKQIVSGITYCHENNICHRDLKPENIIFTHKDDETSLKIIDFGLSTIFEKNKKMTSSIGTIYYMAPEVFLGKYTEKCDVWSLGVLLFILISGRPPFRGENDFETMNSIINDEINFTKWTGWKKISDECKDLIKKILVKDPKKCPSAQELLKEKWLSNLTMLPDEPININLQEIRNYSVLNKFNKAISTFIAQRLSESEVKKLKDSFLTIDSNGNGLLCVDEFKASLREFARVSKIILLEEELDILFRNVDTDNNNYITYNEFIASTFEKKRNITKELIYQAFKTFDTNKNGELSLEEFSKVLIPNNDTEKEELKNIFDEFDKNKDGKIDFDELMANIGDSD